MPEKEKPRPLIGRKLGDQDFLRDLKSFRKETLHVSDEEQAQWRKETQQKTPEPEPPPAAPETPVPRRYHRPPSPYRKHVAVAVLSVALILGLVEMGVFGRFQRPISPPPPSATTQASPQPSVLPPPTVPDTLTLAEAFLVCHFELTWVNSQKNPWEALAEIGLEFDGTGQDGPINLLIPSRETDPLERYLRLIPNGTRADRSLLVSNLTQFIQNAARLDERLLASSLIQDPKTVTDQGQELLTHPPRECKSHVVSMVTALTRILSGKDPKSARELLVLAVKESPADDFWPSRALGLLDAVLGQPGESANVLKARFAANPKDDFTGFELIRSLLLARKEGEVDAAIKTLTSSSKPKPAELLLGVTLAISRNDVKRAESLRQVLEANEEIHTQGLAARTLALKGEIACLKRPLDPAAQPMFENAIRMDPSLSWPCLPLARMLSGKRRVDEAITHYRRYLRDRPASIQARRELATLLTGAKSLGQALGEYQLLLAQDGPRSQYVDAFIAAASELNRPDLIPFFAQKSR